MYSPETVAVATAVELAWPLNDTIFLLFDSLEIGLDKWKLLSVFDKSARCCSGSSE